MDSKEVIRDIVNDLNEMRMSEMNHLIADLELQTRDSSYTSDINVFKGRISLLGQIIDSINEVYLKKQKTKIEMSLNNMRRKNNYTHDNT